MEQRPVSARSSLPAAPARWAPLLWPLVPLVPSASRRLRLWVRRLAPVPPSAPSGVAASRRPAAVRGVPPLALFLLPRSPQGPPA